MSKGRNVSIRVQVTREQAYFLQWLKRQYSVNISELVCDGLATRLWKKVKWNLDEPPNNEGWIRWPSKEELARIREDAEFEKEVKEGE